MAATHYAKRPQLIKLYKLYDMYEVRGDETEKGI
jgi:hypothetical protein